MGDVKQRPSATGRGSRAAKDGNSESLFNIPCFIAG
ncbi:MAG: hypothetical protein BMS9Abin31_0223 [Gammaproteobacteria bacterium]|nr:MAG: hypothetical protein BMS9Abin31_0223 [Gammaproteobacteria bacterium]